MFHKRLFFILKELQLTQRITVNGAVPYTLETSSTNSSLLLKKKNPQGKRKGEREIKGERERKRKGEREKEGEGEREKGG